MRQEEEKEEPVPEIPEPKVPQLLLVGLPSPCRPHPLFLCMQLKVSVLTLSSAPPLLQNKSQEEEKEEPLPEIPEPKAPQLLLVGMNSEQPRLRMKTVAISLDGLLDYNTNDRWVCFVGVLASWCTNRWVQCVHSCFVWSFCLRRAATTCCTTTLAPADSFQSS